MSEDFDRLLSLPTDMTWESGMELTPAIRYRLLDAPLTRYIIGFGRKISSLPAQNVDWDWTTSWHENKQSGALPDHQLLTVARLSVASLFPLGLILIYQLGTTLSSKIAGLTSVLIFATNSLVLLHTRRAMAESVLVFCVLASLIILLIKADKGPWLAGLMVGLAFNAKHSALALLPIGLLAVGWIHAKKPKMVNRISGNLIQYLVGFVIITLLLNPFLWRHPIQAAKASLHQRTVLLQKQVADVNFNASSQVLESASQRVAILMAQLFLIPPSFSEVGNYRNQTAPAEMEYLKFEGHNLWRGTYAGGIMLGITLIGIFALMRNTISGSPETRRKLVLFHLAFLTMALAQIAMVPLPWQRYSIPLIPFTCLYFGIGFTWLIKNSRRIISHGRLSDRLAKILAQLSPDSWMS